MRTQRRRDNARIVIVNPVTVFTHVSLVVITRRDPTPKVLKVANRDIHAVTIAKRQRPCSHTPVSKNTQEPTASSSVLHV